MLVCGVYFFLVCVSPHFTAALLSSAHWQSINLTRRNICYKQKAICLDVDMDTDKSPHSLSKCTMPWWIQASLFLHRCLVQLRDLICPRKSQRQQSIGSHLDFYFFVWFYVFFGGAFLSMHILSKMQSNICCELRRSTEIPVMRIVCVSVCVCCKWIGAHFA